jgi:hypothetical protein
MKLIRLFFLGVLMSLTIIACGGGGGGGSDTSSSNSYTPPEGVNPLTANDRSSWEGGYDIINFRLSDDYGGVITPDDVDMYDGVLNYFNNEYTLKTQIIMNDESAYGYYDSANMINFCDPNLGVHSQNPYVLVYTESCAGLNFYAEFGKYTDNYVSIINLPYWYGYEEISEQRPAELMRSLY